MRATVTVASVVHRGRRSSPVADLAHAEVRHFVVDPLADRTNNPGANARALRLAIDSAIDSAIDGA